MAVPRVLPPTFFFIDIPYSVLLPFSFASFRYRQVTGTNITTLETTRASLNNRNFVCFLKSSMHSLNSLISPGFITSPKTAVNEAHNHRPIPHLSLRISVIVSILSQSPLHLFKGFPRTPGCPNLPLRFEGRPCCVRYSEVHIERSSLGLEGF